MMTNFMYEENREMMHRNYAGTICESDFDTHSCIEYVAKKMRSDDTFNRSCMRRGESAKRYKAYC